MNQFCAAESIFPTHSAIVNIHETQYQLLTSKLDAAMNNFGFHRFEVEGMAKELLDKDTLYFDYKEEKTSQRALLTANDVMKRGRVDIRVYTQVVKDIKMREDILMNINQTLSQFGTKLQSMPGNIE